MARMSIPTRRRRGPRSVRSRGSVDYNHCPPLLNGRPYYGNRNQYAYAFVGDPNPGLVFGTPKITPPYANPGYCVRFEASTTRVTAGASLTLTFSHQLGQINEVIVGRTELSFDVLGNRKIRIRVPDNWSGYLVGAADAQHMVLRMENGWIVISPGDRDGWISVSRRPAIQSMRTRGRR